MRHGGGLARVRPVGFGLNSSTAFRGIIWFLLAMIVLVPKLLDAEFPRPRPSSRLVTGTAALCVFAAVVIGAGAIAHVPQKIAAAFPNSVAATVMQQSAAHPGA